MQQLLHDLFSGFLRSVFFIFVGYDIIVLVMIMLCNICPRNCSAQRTETKGNGYCCCGTKARIARVAPHFGEEPCISGTKGSGAVFFSGCNLKCVFCQNYEISALNRGRFVTSGELAGHYKSLEDMGVHNINLVNCCHYLPSVLDSFNIYRPKIPIVYNSSGYEKTESLKMLDGIVDVYLPDFKYSDNSLALEYSSAGNYRETALSAISVMVRQTGRPQFDENGMILKGVIVRHLILPNHTANSIDVLKILSENFGDSILVSLMGQYIPWGRAKEYPKLSRKVTKREYDKVADCMFSLDLDGYMQELSSADDSYIPKWDLADEV